MHSQAIVKAIAAAKHPRKYPRPYDTPSKPARIPASVQSAFEHNSTNSSFTRLPAEIRGIIFSHIFKDLNLHYYRYPRLESDPEPMTTMTDILFVSTVFHDEALPLLYRNASIDVSCLRWLRKPRLGFSFPDIFTNLSQLRHLRIDVTKENTLETTIDLVKHVPNLKLLELFEYWWPSNGHEDCITGKGVTSIYVSHRDLCGGGPRTMSQGRIDLFSQWKKAKESFTLVAEMCAHITFISPYLRQFTRQVSSHSSGIRITRHTDIHHAGREGQL